MTDSLRLKQSFRKTLAMEEVRLLVQEEGRAARNLIAFSVPVDQTLSEASNSAKASSKKPPTSPRLSFPDGKKEENLRSTKRSSTLTKSRVRSASTGRDKKSELQARYWAFLFGNLQRAVDDIYQTCESDESITECKEVIMVLENYTRDFYNLIEWFKLKWEYENTPPPQRPTSLTWEIRKSSPGKAHTLSTFEKEVSSKYSVKSDTSSQDSAEGTVATRIISMHSPPLRANPPKERGKVEESAKPAKCVDDSSDVPKEDTSETLSALSVLSEVDEAKKELCSNSESHESPPIENVLAIANTHDQETIGNPDSSVSAINEVENDVVVEVMVSSSAEPLILQVESMGSENCGTQVEEHYNDCPPSDQLTYVNSEDEIPKSMVSQASQTEEEQTGWEASLAAPAETQLPLTTDSSTQPDHDLLDASPSVKQVPTSVQSLGDATKVAKVIATQNKTIQPAGQKTLSGKCEDQVVATGLGKDVPGARGLLARVGGRGRGITGALVGVLGAKGTDAPGLRGSQRSETEVPKGRGRAEITRARVTPSRVVTGRGMLGGPALGVLARSSSAFPASGQVPKLMRSRTVVEGTSSASSSWSMKRQSSTESTARTSKTSPSAMRQLRPTSGTPAGGVASCRTPLSGLVRKDVRSHGVHSSLNNIQSRSSWAVHHCGSSKLAEQQHPRGGRKTASNSSLHSSASSTSSASTVRSWADKVKGSPVENTKTQMKAASPNLKEESTSDLPASEMSKKPSSAGEDDDSQGWETVRNRSSRSRISPASKVASLNVNALENSAVENSGGLGSSLSRSAGNITKVLAKKDPKAGLTVDGAVKEPARRSFPQTRFQRPSSATSLPALTSLGGNSKVHSPSPPKEGRSRGNGKKNQGHSGNGKVNSISKKVANLNNINTQKSAMNEPSPDSLKNVAIELSPMRDFDKQRKSKDNSIKSKCDSVNEDGILADISQRMENMMNGVGNDEKNNDEDASNAIGDLGGKGSPEGKSLDSDSNLMNDEVLRKTEELSAEEEKLEQEIMELEKTEIEVDTETEETETDGEACAGPGDEEDERLEVVTPEDRETIEAKYENMLAGMSWAERMEALEQLEAMAARHPGRALELHQKLSSPSRKRSLAETLRRYQAKQAQAEEKRQRLQELKAMKLRELFKKIGEVREAKAQNIEAKREQLEQKLRRAEEKRRRHLQGIVRKAHDEEEKLKEIAFINELEAQNKRHDFMAHCQEQEERRLGIIEERQRKQEEKAAKEAAVEERRKALEAERQAKLEEMQERRRKREERIDREQQEKEKERLELAREKARDREERRSALQAAQLANQEELQRKIKQKQEESARRHDHNMELIRQRALALESCSMAGRGPGEESSLPRLSPYETNKFCNICNVLIESEVYLFSHLRGKKHQESLRSQTLQQKVGSEGHGAKESPSPINMCSMEHIVDAPADKIDPKIAQDRERQKALKKRCKKIRQRMAQKGQEYENMLEKSPKNVESSNKSRLQKLIKDVEKLNHSQGKGQWPDVAITALERALGEINRILDKQNVVDKVAFQALGGFAALTSLLEMAVGTSPNITPSLPPKCYITTCTTYNLACNGCPGNSKYVLLSNKITTVLDFLLQRLSGLIPFRQPVHGGSSGGANRAASGTPPVDPVAGALMRLLSLVLSSFASSETLSIHNRDGKGGDGLSAGGAVQEQRIQDVICYAVSVGVVDKLASYCGGVRDPIDSDPAAAHFLLGAIGLISTLAACSASIRGSSKAAGKGSSGGGGEGPGRRGGSASSSCSSSGPDPSDPTQLVSALQATEAVGAASMLYGMLLHQGAPARSSRDAASSSDASDEEGGLGGGTSPLPSPVPPALPPHTLAVTLATFRLFTRVAELDLRMFQNVLGAEGISLQFRHIASYLLWYCSHHRERDLLHEVVRVVGFFAVGNHDNQAIIQSGYMPTVLQQLCSLPFEYFSSPPLTKVLFPTLLACCRGNRQNRHILEREVSYQLLEDFRSSEDARDIVLVHLVSEQTSEDADDDAEENFGDK